MAGSMVVAGGFDYLVNVLVGRLLLPAEFSVFVTVTALLQVMVQATNVIRNVVAYYTAEATVHADRIGRVGAVLQQSWRWAIRWGVVAMLLMAVLSPLLARFLRLEATWPLWAACFALLLLFLRPVTDGGLQGIQYFSGLGLVQIVQAVMRLILTAVLVYGGWQATGAILALPLASTAALALALGLLLPYFRTVLPEGMVRPISWRYALYTLLGLLAFALMTNVDAIVVRRFFGDAAAEAYGPVVTLGKINLFVPLGIGLVFFPKATQRHAAGRDARPVLLLALAATLLPGLLLTAVYFLWPGRLVELVFGAAYADPGRVLGLVGLATTLYAGVNIWLNYALSLERRIYIVALVIIVLLQVGGMVLFHGRLETIALLMVAAALLANVAGTILLYNDSGEW